MPALTGLFRRWEVRPTLRLLTPTEKASLGALLDGMTADLRKRPDVSFAAVSLQYGPQSEGITATIVLTAPSAPGAAVDMATELLAQACAAAGWQWMPSMRSWWKWPKLTRAHCSGGLPLWLGEAIPDKATSPATVLLTHRIAPESATEREYVVSRRQGDGLVAQSQTLQLVPPGMGKSFDGDPLLTDGKADIVWLASSRPVCHLPRPHRHRRRGDLPA
ncbi:MAG TPA: LssY C-terminal domain-containing protein [Ktedonobacterales bacterium]